MDALDFEASNIDALFDQRVRSVINKSFTFDMYFLKYKVCNVSKVFKASQGHFCPIQQISWQEGLQVCHMRLLIAHISVRSHVKRIGVIGYRGYSRYLAR